mgnify:CR=1 FL=1|jgi:hypothetical protein
MSVRCKGTDLQPVLAEAVVNGCRVVAIKDQGVSFLAGRDEHWRDGRESRQCRAKTVALPSSPTRSVS